MQGSKRLNSYSKRRRLSGAQSANFKEKVHKPKSWTLAVLKMKRDFHKGNKKCLGSKLNFVFNTRRPHLPLGLTILADIRKVTEMLEKVLICNLFLSIYLCIWKFLSMHDNFLWSKGLQETHINVLNPFSSKCMTLTLRGGLWTFLGNLALCAAYNNEQKQKYIP